MLSADDIFNLHVNQHKIHEKCIGQGIVEEENFTALTYETSESGKTFALPGDDHNPGIISSYFKNVFGLYEGRTYPHPSIKTINGRITTVKDHVIAKENLMRKTILAQDLELESQFLPKGPVCPLMMRIYWLGEHLSRFIIKKKTHDLLATESDAPKYGVQLKVFRKNFCLETTKLLRYGKKMLKYETSINPNSSRPQYKGHILIYVNKKMPPRRIHINFVIKPTLERSIEQEC
uniref:Kinesin motor domain-containing protein n=1 Tax=Glossina austeni TaxID=7395 RepID=A0A1A9UVT4_GLOAU